MSEVRNLMPDFSPVSIVDVGAGPGTATWAALSVWDGIAAVRLAEVSAAFRELAGFISQESGLEVLQRAEVLAVDASRLAAEPADLVVASYVLAEMPEGEAAGVAQRLWSATNNVLLLVEPGTPQGFSRIRAARAALIAAGAHVIAPCTHDLACPMAGGDWCHFKERLARSRAHMHAKGASVPYEDEPFSWVAVSREAAQRASGRIVRPVTVSKISVDMTLCSDGRLKEVIVAARDRASYKAAKRKQWGEAV